MLWSNVAVVQLTVVWQVVQFAAAKAVPADGCTGFVGLLPGRQMASGISAIGRRDRQIVVIVDMAERAGHVRVAIGQQESGRAVVELGVHPIVKRMAGRAVRGRKRSSGRWMDRIASSVCQSDRWHDEQAVESPR